MGSKLTLSDLIGYAPVMGKRRKIEFNMTNGAGAESLLDKWQKLSESDKCAGNTLGVGYNGYRPDQANFAPGDEDYSFVQLPRKDEWLLVSAALIVENKRGQRPKIEVLECYKMYFGRLVIKFNKNPGGFGNARYCFTLKKEHLDAEVLEIHGSLYDSLQFEGYDKVCLSMKELQDIIGGRVPAYREALESVYGIYCLTDKKTGKHYVGSAYGKGGVGGRWNCYAETKDGGNKELVELRKQLGEAYFDENFQFTLLETFGKTMPKAKEKVLEREKYWKRVLMTREHGYNAN